MYLLLVLSLPQAGHHLSLHVSVDCSLPRLQTKWGMANWAVQTIWPFLVALLQLAWVLGGSHKRFRYCGWLSCTQVVPVTYHQYDEYPREKKGLSQDLVLDMAAWDLPHLRASSTVLRTMITPRVLENHWALGNGQIIYRADFLETRNWYFYLGY